MKMIGYTYKAGDECPSCMLRRAKARVENNEIVVVGEVDVEHWLDLWAIIDGIDRTDESTYDADEFPKAVIDLDDGRQWTCGRCSVPLNESQVVLCPACGYTTDYCTGHGMVGDPLGYLTLKRHDLGDHTACRVHCAAAPHTTPVTL